MVPFGKHWSPPLVGPRERRAALLSYEKGGGDGYWSARLPARPVGLSPLSACLCSSCWADAADVAAAAERSLVVPHNSAGAHQQRR